MKLSNFHEMTNMRHILYFQVYFIGGTPIPPTLLTFKLRTKEIREVSEPSAQFAVKWQI